MDNIFCENNQLEFYNDYYENNIVLFLIFVYFYYAFRKLFYETSYDTDDIDDIKYTDCDDDDSLLEYMDISMNDELNNLNDIDYNPINYINQANTDNDVNMDNTDNDVNIDNTDNDINLDNTDNDINLDNTDNDVNLDNTDNDVNLDNTDNDVNLDNTDNDINLDNTDNDSDSDFDSDSDRIIDNTDNKAYDDELSLDFDLTNSSIIMCSITQDCLLVSNSKIYSNIIDDIAYYIYDTEYNYKNNLLENHNENLAYKKINSLVKDNKFNIEMIIKLDNDFHIHINNNNIITF